MKATPKRIIAFLFYALALLPPLVLYKYTSELFEFNKIIVVYLLTVLIAFFWGFSCVAQKKFIFRRTKLDIPIVFFLLSLGFSTLLSIDKITSVYGYPSRFHGGLLSWISYSILYWAFVSNLGKKQAKKFLVVLLLSGVLVGLYGILQHFGIDDQVWEQDVKTRIFSTLGQPNWLAAWLTPLVLLTLAKILKVKDAKTYWVYNTAFVVMTIALLFTRSRSGILSFFVSLIYFGIIVVFVLYKNNNQFIVRIKKILKSSLYVLVTAFVLILVIGTPWTNSLFQNQNTNPGSKPTRQSATADITASEDIRKIVWQGAFDIWKDYPVFGTGVETFAYSYYQYRPVAHNYVSEWDFLYNKAHNEYLNTLATTGILGLISYIIFTFFALLIPFRFSLKKNSNFYLHAALSASIVSIVITNFFGFSVVPVVLIFVLFPAVSLSLESSSKSYKKQDLTTSQLMLIGILGAFAVYLIFSIYNYWYADVLYTKGKINNSYGNYNESQKLLTSAVGKNPNQPFYFAELAQSSTAMALSLYETGSEEKARDYAQIAESQVLHATALNNKNPNIYRVYAGLTTSLSIIDPTYLTNAKDAYDLAEVLAPTDPKIKYRLGLTLVRLGNTEEGISKMKEAIEIKKDYIDPRYALAQTYSEIKEEEKAIEELRYIVENITPNNEAVNLLLESLKSE